MCSKKCHLTIKTAPYKRKLQDLMCDHCYAESDALERIIKEHRRAIRCRRSSGSCGLLRLLPS